MFVLASSDMHIQTSTEHDCSKLKHMEKLSVWESCINFHKQHTCKLLVLIERTTKFIRRRISLRKFQTSTFETVFGRHLL